MPNDEETYIETVFFYCQEDDLLENVEYVWGDVLPYRGTTVNFNGRNYEVKQDYLTYTQGRLTDVRFVVERV